MLAIILNFHNLKSNETVFSYFLFLLFFIVAFGQTNPSDNYLSWSSTRKLTIEDFVIKTANLQTTPSFAQFNVDYHVSGFDFMAKNFKKKVHNYIIKSASWIDTTFNVVQSLKYQQTLFDICEIYTRRFRKELKDNRKKLFQEQNSLKS